MGDTIKNQYLPNYVVPPGEILEEALEGRGMSQVELSERTGLAQKAINEIIKAKASITPESALEFECVFRQPAEYWLNLENLYREALARKKEYFHLENVIVIVCRKRHPAVPSWRISRAHRILRHLPN